MNMLAPRLQLELSPLLLAANVNHDYVIHLIGMQNYKLFHDRYAVLIMHLQIGKP